jgi:hypothetical protein
MKFTKYIWEKGRSSNGGWNNLQIKVLGIEKLYKGWLNDLDGKEFSEETLEKFIELKDYHFKKRAEIGKGLREKIAIKMGLIKFEPILKKISYKEQYLHPNWQKLRLLIFKRDKYSCVNCRNKDKTLHVHHLKYLKDKFIWEVPVWYLVTLCEDCHSIEHNRDLRAK